MGKCQELEVLKFVNSEGLSSWQWFRYRGSDLSSKKHSLHFIKGSENQLEYTLKIEDVDYYIGILYKCQEEEILEEVKEENEENEEDLTENIIKNEENIEKNEKNDEKSLENSFLEENSQEIPSETVKNEEKSSSDEISEEILTEIPSEITSEPSPSIESSPIPSSSPSSSPSSPSSPSSSPSPLSPSLSPEKFIRSDSISSTSTKFEIKIEDALTQEVIELDIHLESEEKERDFFLDQAQYKKTNLYGPILPGPPRMPTLRVNGTEFLDKEGNSLNYSPFSTENKEMEEKNLNLNDLRLKIGSYAIANYVYMGGYPGKIKFWWMKVGQDGTRKELTEPVEVEKVSQELDYMGK